jgi:hypothetical protein
MGGIKGSRAGEGRVRNNKPQISTKSTRCGQNDSHIFGGFMFHISLDIPPKVREYAHRKNKGGFEHEDQI